MMTHITQLLGPNPLGDAGERIARQVYGRHDVPLHPLAGVTPGTVGDGTHVAVVKADLWGRVLSLTSAAITAGGMAIGGTVTSGTTGSLLYVAAGPVLAEDNAHLSYDASAKKLTVTDGTYSIELVVSSAGSALRAVGGGATVYLCSAVGTAVTATGPGSGLGIGPVVNVTDGTNTVILCNSTYALSISAGLLNTPGTSGNTYRWNVGTTAPTPQTLLTLPLNVYGQGTITDLLGDPDAWVLVNIGGTDYKLPAYLP